MSARFTIKEASEYLHIPVNTLRWYRSSGHTGPKSYTLGGTVFYDRDDVDAWVADQKAATTRGGS